MNPTLQTLKYLLAATLVLAAVPASAQQLNPLQQYLYYESGYAPPHLATPQATTTVQSAYVAPGYPPVVATDNAAPDGYYEDEGSSVGPSSGTSSLRGLLTAAGN